MADLIDREILKKELIKRWYKNDNHDFSNKEVWEALENAPSAKPPPETCWGCNCPKMEEPKKGRWNWIEFNIECSLCGFTPYFNHTEPLYNYCPHCGSTMEVEE